MQNQKLMLSRKRKYFDSSLTMVYKIQYVVNVNTGKDMDNSPQFKKKIISQDVQLGTLQRQCNFFNQFKNKVRLSQRQCNQQYSKKRQQKLLKRILWQQEQRKIDQCQNYIDEDLDIDQITLMIQKQSYIEDE